MTKKTTKKAVVKPVKKAATKKTSAKKAVTKVAETQVAAVKTVAPAVEKPVVAEVQPKSVGKPVAKKATKAPAKKAGATTVVAKVDVGFGNSLFVRGEGAGLSWDQGVAMTNDGSDEWTIELSGKAEFKLLRNDTDWCYGENFVASAGKKTVVAPVF